MLPIGPSVPRAAKKSSPNVLKPAHETEVDGYDKPAVSLTAYAKLIDAGQRNAGFPPQGYKQIRAAVAAGDEIPEGQIKEEYYAIVSQVALLAWTEIQPGLPAAFEAQWNEGKKWERDGGLDPFTLFQTAADEAIYQQMSQTLDHLEANDPNVGRSLQRLEQLRSRRVLSDLNQAFPKQIIANGSLVAFDLQSQILRALVLPMIESRAVVSDVVLATRELTVWTDEIRLFSERIAHFHIDVLPIVLTNVFGQVDGHLGVVFCLGKGTQFHDKVFAALSGNIRLEKRLGCPMGDVRDLAGNTIVNAAARRAALMANQYLVPAIVELLSRPDVLFTGYPR